jgi:phage baseplate assembly protein V
MSDQRIRAELAAMKRRLDGMFARGTITTVHDQKLQHLDARLLIGETPTRLEHFQHYGYTARPLAGAEVIAGFLGGNRDHGFVLGFDDRRYRLKGLADGEVALYDDQGQTVVIGRDGIKIKTAKKVTIESGEPVTIDAPRINAGKDASEPVRLCGGACATKLYAE